MAKEGSTVSGLMDTLATSVSLALQYGVPLKDVVNKFAHVRFEPSGFTGNSEIPIAKSLVDYIFRWLGIPVPADGRQGLARADRPLGDRGRGAGSAFGGGLAAAASGAVAITPPAAVSPAPVVEPDSTRSSAAPEPPTATATPSSARAARSREALFPTADFGGGIAAAASGAVAITPPAAVSPAPVVEPDPDPVDEAAPEPPTATATAVSAPPRRSRRRS